MTAVCTRLNALRTVVPLTILLIAFTIPVNIVQADSILGEKYVCLESCTVPLKVLYYTTKGSRGLTASSTIKWDERAVIATAILGRHRKITVYPTLTILLALARSGEIFKVEYMETEGPVKVDIDDWYRVGAAYYTKAAGRVPVEGLCKGYESYSVKVSNMEYARRHIETIIYSAEANITFSAEADITLIQKAIHEILKRLLGGGFNVELSAKAKLTLRIKLEIYVGVYEHRSSIDATIYTESILECPRCPPGGFGTLKALSSTYETCTQASAKYISIDLFVETTQLGVER